jgi:outer membrane lipoprotein SlyB
VSDETHTEIQKMNRFKKGIIVSTLLALPLAGCESKAGTGAIVGGVGGAAVGGLIGSKSHARAGEGALIGGAVGALGGALVGHGMDKADEKKKDQTYASSSGEQHYHQRGDSTYTTNSNRITNTTVMDWTRQGVKEDIIIDRIQRSGQTFYLSTTDERDLRNAGVSPAVIQAMKNAR